MNAIAETFDDAEPLSSVVFVHDYVQLVFQDLILSVFAPLSVTVEETSILHGERGFADELVALIGASVVSTEFGDNLFNLAFDQGAVVSFDASDGSVPEAFTLPPTGSPRGPERARRCSRCRR
jgi:hypothetical protein